MASPGQPNSIPTQVPGKFTPLPDPNGGGNTDFFRNVSNWAGDVGRAAKGATVQTTKWGQRNLSATGLANIGNDIGHAEQVGRGAFGAMASRNLSDQGISHIYHDALGFGNEANKAINATGAYFGLPKWLTGDTGSNLTYTDTYNNFANSLGSKLEDAVGGFFKGKTYTDVGSAGGGYISNVVNAAQKSVSDINLAIKAQVFEDPNAIKQLQQQQLQEQPGLGADPSAAPLKAIGKPIADTTAHMAGAATTAAFDNLQHMYRAAELAYQRDGVQGVLDVLSPAIIGAAVGSLVGNPEIGLGASGVTDLAGATIGSVPTDVVGSAAARTALEAGTTADNQTIGSAAAKAAEEAAAKTAGPTVAEEQAMARAITASKIVRHGASIITKPVGGIMKGLGEATSSPANIGGQLGMQAWYLPGSPEHDIWMKSRVATGDLSTFGRAVSKQLGFGENSVVSGVLDGLIFLQEGPFTTGRAAAQSNGTVLGKLVSGHSVTVVDRTSVETAYRTNPGTRRTIDNIVKRGQTPLSKEEIAKGINPVTKLTGEIVRLHRELEGIAPYLAEAACNPGATSWDVVQEIGGLAEAESYKSIQVPTTGLYGMLKSAKLSDGKVSSFFSRNLAQSPMSYDDSVRSITKLTLNPADKNFGAKLGALLQQTGMKSSHISYLIGSVVRSGDRVAIDNTIKQALKENFYQRIDRRILSNLPKQYRDAIQQEMETGELSPESIAMLESHLNTKGFESAYHALRNSISDRVDQLVNSAPGADGIYSRESTTGNPDSTVGMANGPRQAALYENQMGEIILPDYRTFDKELRRFFDKLAETNVSKKTSQSFDDFIGNTVIDGTYGTTHIDEWVNERFFKPLTLLTPGWALRVSLSELALNTFRLGPGNMLAGRQTAGMIKTNTKMFGRAQEFAKVHLKNLEEDISHDQSLVDAAKKAGDGIKERGYQQQVNQKQAHLDWLKSPAGTEKPTTLNVPTNIPFPKGGTTSEHLIYDGGAPGMETVNGITHDNAVKNADELQTRIDNNIANRTKPETDRARGAINGVVDRIIADIKRNQPDWYKAEIERDLVTNIEQFVRMIGVHLFDVGPEGGVRISNVFRAKDLEKAGQFNFADGTIKIWGRAFANGIDQTTIHELWHHLSQFVSKDAIDGIEKELSAARKKFLDKNNLVEFAQKKLEGLPKDINHSAYHGDRFSPQENPYYAELRFWRKFLDKSPASLENNTAHFDEKLWGELPMSYKGTDGYRLTNTDEWFAETMRDMTNGEMKYRNPVMEIGHRLLNLFWSALNKTVGTAQSKAIFNNFIKHRYSEANWDWGSLQYRANGDNALNITANQEINKIGPSALNPPERLFTTDIQAHLASKGYKIPMTAAENLAMIARGVAVGLDQAIITAFGKDEFIKNAAYLMWRHGGYLAPAVDSRHNIALSMVDMSAFETVGKRKFLKKPLQDAEGKPVLDDKGNVIKEAPFKYNKKTEQMKTKQVFYKGKPVWGQANLFANGYFEGWQYMASTMMGSTYLGRPLAGTYLDLVNKGMQGQALHDAAVSEARKLIEAMPEDVRGIMARKENVALGDNPNDPYLSWASKLVNNLEAVASREQHAIRTAEETIRSEKPPVIRYAVNKPLLRDIADGNLVPDINSFRKKYSILNEDGNLNQTAMPLKVTSRLPQAIGGSQFINQLSAYGHGKVLGPMVNYLSRQPTYIAEFMAERKLLESRVKEGILNADQADVIAETNATQNMVRYIHNPDDKTKFEEMMRIASPFYFAQNQAWRRMGRLFADNPGAFMQYAATMYGVQQVAQQYKDKTGMATFLIPGLSLWGVPFMGSTSSLQTMDPSAQQLDPTGALNPLQTIREMVGPHMGPVVSIPLEAFTALIPALKENKVTGTAIDTTLGPIASQQTWGQNLYQALIPNSILRNLVVGIRGFASSNNGSDFTLNSYNNAKLEAFTYIATEMSRTEWNRLSKIKYSNDATDDKFLRSKAFAEWNSKTFGAAANSWQQQQFLDAANKKAGLIWAAKLAVGLISPIAISTGAAEQKLRDQFTNYIADKKYKGNFADAISAYERDHPYATLETISKSKSVSGARIPINQEAGDFMQSNADTINRYPLAAWAYGPDLSKDPTFSEPTNMAMMASGIRERLTPDDFYKSFLVATGNAYYYGHIKPYYELYKESSGAYAWKQQKMDSYGGTFNKVWYDNYKSQAAVSTKDQAYTQIKEMVQQPQYKNLPVTALYKELIRQVEQDLKPAIIEAKNGSYTFQEVKDAWEQRMDDFRKKHPEAGPGIDAVFYNQG